MKNIPSIVKTGFLVAIIMMLTPAFDSPDNSKNYESLWKEVESMNQKGLPKSALEKLEAIQQLATAEKNYPQLIKANIYQYGLFQSFEEDHLIKAIENAQALLPILESPAKELMHSITAELYWFYYQQNRYKLLERSAVAMGDMPDIREWDITRLRDTIELHYALSLGSQAILDTVPLKQYRPILHKAEEEAWEIQPGLFGFVASRALNYYMTKDAALQDAIADKALEDESLWQSAAFFAAMKLPKMESAHQHILSIFQQILASNLRQQQNEALIYNEIQRFKYLKNHFHDNKTADSLYLHGLEQLQLRNAGIAASTMVAAERASYLLQKTSTLVPDSLAAAKALEICDQAMIAFPESRGAKRCRVYKDQILEKSLYLSMQRVELPEQAIAARLEYRNITKPGFRIIKIESEALEAIMAEPDEKIRMSKMLALTPLHEWSLEFDFEADYATHSTIIELPALQNGLYLLLTAEESKFVLGNAVGFSSFQVSRLSFVQNKRSNGNLFYVLDRESGKALANVDVHIITRDYDYAKRKHIAVKRMQLKTEKDGSFEVNPGTHLPANQAFYVDLLTKNDTLYSDNYFDLYVRKPNTRTQTKSWFFTDRAIYRPGQTVYFKGILLEKEGSEAEWELKKSENTKVRFLDVNHKEISTQNLRTNEFGSFEGMFTIPQNLLSGQMQLRNEYGSVYIRVENYKRPSFETILDKAEEQYSLNDQITLYGQARAFAGYGLDNAEVRYRVERRQNFPYWPWWRGFPPIYQSSKQIAEGKTHTAQDGSFSISFVAAPDAEASKNEHITYTYTVTADVIDRNGETRSSQTYIRVGNVSLLMKTNLKEVVPKDWISEATLSLTNLQDKPVNAMVSTRFYLVKPPKRLLRPALLDETDREYISKDEMEKLFPLDHFVLKGENLEEQKELVHESKQFVNGSAMVFPEDISSWPEGNYIVEFVADDDKGREVKLEQNFLLFDTKSKNVAGNETAWFYLDKATAEPGDTITLYIASAASDNRVLVEITAADEIRYSEWHRVNKRKITIPYIVKEEDRGQLQFQSLMVRHNRQHQFVSMVDVPHSNKNLDITLETVREKLIPGAEEKWILHIRGNDKEKVAAELLASMYDASLDQFTPHQWQFSTINHKAAAYRWMYDNGFLLHASRPLYSSIARDYYIDHLDEIRLNWFGLDSYNMYLWGNGRIAPMMARKEMSVQAADGLRSSTSGMQEILDDSAEFEEESQAIEELEEAQSHMLRSDFRETAFFYPQLRTDANGNIRIEFKLPDALTKWKLMLLAHTQDLKSGLNTYTFEASKDLMIVPNHARFYREGDTAWFAAKVVNMGDKNLNGIASIELRDAVTNELLPLVQTQQQLAVANLQAGQSKEIKWKAVISASSRLLAVKYSVSAGTYADSEEQWIPLLPSGIIARESLPMAVPANSSRSFDFKSITNPVDGENNLRLVLQYTNHPVWYAIQALPYLQQQENASIDLVFNRFYANSLSSYVAASIPNLMQLIKSWETEGSDALLSNLEKNPDLKAIVLEETPWVMAAADESEQKRALKVLFDINRMQYERQNTLQKLADAQLPDGSWPWFPGMRGNSYTTRNIVLGLGRLMDLMPDLAKDPVLQNVTNKALQYLTEEMLKSYKKLEKEQQLKSYQISSYMVDQLMIYSYFPNYKMDKSSEQAAVFFMDKLSAGWLKLSLDNQAKAALVLFRGAKKEQAEAVLRSLKEKSLSNEALGVYWKHQKFGTASAIESQAIMIAAFSEITQDIPLIDGIRQWLLVNKQTNRWPSARATSEAVFALLQNGTQWVEGQKPAQISLGGHVLSFENAEAGSGFVEKQWSDIKAELGKVEIVNPNPVMGWGGLFREYSVSLDNVRESQTNLQIKRELLINKGNATAPVWQVINSHKLYAGDRIKVRLVIETDRDMEFVHLRDMRAAAFEPKTNLSGYKWNAELSYYEAIGDLYTDFFFDYLPKGKYVLEYHLIAMQQGDFAHGYANLQSYYAPEMSANSKALRVKIHTKD